MVSSVYDPDALSTGIFSSLTPHNPNILLTCSLKKLNLPQKRIYWPRAEIEIFEGNELVYFATENLAESDQSINSVWVKAFEKSLYGRVKHGKHNGSPEEKSLKGMGILGTGMKEVE